jgi:hypothetical protein
MDIKTIIIRARDSTDDSGWPVELCFNDGDGDWDQEPQASGKIPPVIETASTRHSVAH